jgi:hypothetical protein
VMKSIAELINELKVCLQSLDIETIYSLRHIGTSQKVIFFENAEIYKLYTSILLGQTRKNCLPICRRHAWFLLQHAASAREIKMTCL